MQTTTPVTKALDELNIPYQLHVHENQIRSLEQAAEERGLEPEQIVRSLIFRCEGLEYVMILMPGPMKVSWLKLRRYLGVSRITTATSEQVQELTGYEPGAVSPFGLPSTLRILADRSILVDDPKDKTFIPFGDARHKIANGEIVKSREMYFALYQAIAKDERRPGLYREYSPDFFDLIL